MNTYHARFPVSICEVITHDVYSLQKFPHKVEIRHSHSWQGKMEIFILSCLRGFTLLFISHKSIFVISKCSSTNFRSWDACFMATSSWSAFVCLSSDLQPISLSLKELWSWLCSTLYYRVLYILATQSFLWRIFCRKYKEEVTYKTKI